MGGLHENLYSSALFMKEKKHDVWVVLKDGPLNERLNSHGINTIVIDYEYISQTLGAINDVDVKFDIVHTHPGPARKAALHYAKQHDIPLVMTFHGMWSDSLRLYHERINSIVCVSEGVKDFIKSQSESIEDKCYVVPNGYDSELFNYPSFYNNTSNDLTIGLITRLDEDKKFILDIFMIALRHLNKNYQFNITFKIIGDGKLRNEFLDQANEILTNSNHNIDITGWLVDKELQSAYIDCDIIIAPGRSAIESMACGKPTIAVGSKKYIGLIKHDNWKQGIYNNFGGYGNKFNDYINGTIEKELDFLLKNDSNLILLGKFSYDIAKTFFNAESINTELLTLYKIINTENDIYKSFTSNDSTSQEY